VEENNTVLGAVALGRALKDIDQLHQRDFEAKNSIEPILHGVVEEVVMHDLLFEVDGLVAPVGEDHVVKALEGVPSDLGSLHDDVDVILEITRPMDLAIGLQTLVRFQELMNIEATLTHISSMTCPYEDPVKRG
jgi:hypothetical protein